MVLFFVIWSWLFWFYFFIFGLLLLFFLLFLFLLLSLLILLLAFLCDFLTLFFFWLFLLLLCIWLLFRVLLLVIVVVIRVRQSWLPWIQVPVKQGEFVTGHRFSLELVPWLLRVEHAPKLIRLGCLEEHRLIDPRLLGHLCFSFLCSCLHSERGWVDLPAFLEACAEARIGLRVCLRPQHLLEVLL